MNRQERKREGRGNNKFLTIINEKTNKQTRENNKRTRGNEQTNKRREGEVNATVHNLYDFFILMIALVQ